MNNYQKKEHSEKEIEFNKNVRETFKEEMNRDITECELEEFINRWKIGEKGFGIFVYIDEIREKMK